MITGLQDKISTARLVRCLPPRGPGTGDRDFTNVRKDDYVAILDEGEVKVLQVVSKDPLTSIRGRILEIPPQERHGGFARRPWSIVEERGPVVVPWERIICRVKLSATSTLEPASLESIRAYLEAAPAVPSPQ